MNHVGDVFVDIVDADFFDEIMHNFFCLVIVAMRGEKSANDCPINVMAIGKENFLPVENGRIDMFAP